jgi:hypothetical protein
MTCQLCTMYVIDFIDLGCDYVQRSWNTLLCVQESSMYSRRIQSTEDINFWTYNFQLL